MRGRARHGSLSSAGARQAEAPCARHGARRVGERQHALHRAQGRRGDEHEAAADGEAGGEARGGRAQAAFGP
eukprot:5450925-Prymnesium_polylepis.1